MSTPETVKLGDKVWFANGGPDLSSGEVVHIFELHDRIMYVIEMRTHIDDHYEVRDWNTITLDPDKPLNFWRGLSKRIHDK